MDPSRNDSPVDHPESDTAEMASRSPDIPPAGDFGARADDDGWSPARLKRGIGSIWAGIKRRLPRVLLLLVSLGTILGTLWFFRRRTESKKFMTNTRLSIMDKEVRRACRHIEKRHADPELTIETICSELVTGEAFLNALFERELGMSVGEFVDQVRINRARLILDAKPDADPSWMASQTGFTEMEEFLKTFERITGTTYVDYLRALDHTQKSA